MELRNPEYLSPDYFDLLASRNVAHVFNAWTEMPALDEQVQLLGAITADFTVVRALLRTGRTFDQAVKTFQPYKLTQEPNEGAREGMRQIAENARKKIIPAFLFVNNRLEGNAPGTIEEVVGRIIP